MTDLRHLLSSGYNLAIHGAPLAWEVQITRRIPGERYLHAVGFWSSPDLDVAISEALNLCDEDWEVRDDSPIGLPAISTTPPVDLRTLLGIGRPTPSSTPVRRI